MCSLHSSASSLLPPSLHPFSLQLFTFPYTYLWPRCLLLAPPLRAVCHGRGEAAVMSHRWLSPLYVIVFSRWLPQGLYPSKCTVSHHCYCLCGRLPVHAGAKSALVLSLHNHCAGREKWQPERQHNTGARVLPFEYPSLLVCVCHGSDWWRDVCKEIGGRGGGVRTGVWGQKKNKHVFFLLSPLHCWKSIESLCLFRGEAFQRSMMRELTTAACAQSVQLECVRVLNDAAQKTFGKIRVALTCPSPPCNLEELKGRGGKKNPNSNGETREKTQWN